jgi:hypothetical protein
LANSSNATGHHGIRFPVSGDCVRLVRSHEFFASANSYSTRLAIHFVGERRQREIKLPHRIGHAARAIGAKQTPFAALVLCKSCA